MTAPRSTYAAELPPLEVVEIVDPKQYVEVYFAKEPLMLAIAECESGMRHYDKNGKVLRGYVDRRDIGLFQINTRYWLEEAKELGLDIYDPIGNIKMAEHIYNKKGSSPWNASKPCWGETNQR